MHFLTKWNVPNGSSGLAIYRAPASKLVCGTSFPFLQTTDQEHSNLTMVTCFFARATFSFNSSRRLTNCLHKQFQRAGRFFFLSFLHLELSICQKRQKKKS